MDISSSIDKLSRRFIASPANYLVEAELAFELKQILNDQLPPAELQGTHDEGSSRGDIPDHSDYADAILSSESFDRVHCEVSGKNFGLESNQRKLDLVIFQERVDLSLEGGSKKFSAADLDTAVEIKFIKNAHYLRAGAKRFELIRRDIDRLDNLPDHVDTYCLVFGNFDLARRADNEEALRSLKAQSSLVEMVHVHPLSKPDTLI